MSAPKILETQGKGRGAKSKDATDQGQSSVSVPVAVKPSTTNMIGLSEERWEKNQ